MGGDTGVRGLRVVVLTNVGPSIVEAYLAPLVSLEEVAEVVVVRDRPDVAPGRGIRVVTPPAWWARTTAGKLLARSWLLRGEAAERPVDVLMTVHWFPDGPGVCRLGRRLGAPVIANIVGSRAELLDGGRRLALTRLPAWLKRWAQEYQREWLDAAAALTFTGTATRDWFRAAGVTRPHLSVVHAAIDAERLRPAGERRDIDVAYVGRFDPDKRIDRLMRVLARMGRRRADLRATVVGMAEEEVARLPEYAEARAALGAGLTLVRRVERIEDVLSRARVLMLTSDTEGRTLAALEAMACGAVPVVPDVGDLREALDGGAAGVLVGGGSGEERLADALADAACALLGDEARRRALAEQAARHVAREHSFQRTRGEWRALLAAVLHPGAAAGG